MRLVAMEQSFNASTTSQGSRAQRELTLGR